MEITNIFSSSDPDYLSLIIALLSVVISIFTFWWSSLRPSTLYITKPNRVGLMSYIENINSHNSIFHMITLNIGFHNYGTNNILVEDLILRITDSSNQVLYLRTKFEQINIKGAIAQPQIVTPELIAFNSFNLLPNSDCSKFLLFNNRDSNGLFVLTPDTYKLEIFVLYNLNEKSVFKKLSDLNLNISEADTNDINSINVVFNNGVYINESRERSIPTIENNEMINKFK